MSDLVESTSYLRNLVNFRHFSQRISLSSVPLLSLGIYHLSATIRTGFTPFMIETAAAPARKGVAHLMCA